MAGVEKVQVYASYTYSITSTPLFQLCGVYAAELDVGEKKVLTLSIDKYWVQAVLEDGTRVSPDGRITLYVGGHQPDAVSCALLGDVFTIELS